MTPTEQDIFDLKTGKLSAEQFDAKYGAGADVVSIGELKKALNRSFNKEKIKLNWKENYSAKENYSRFIKEYLR